MMDAIDAEDAWWPPTFSPDGLGRTRLAWCTMAVDSHSTRRSTSSSTPECVAVATGSFIVGSFASAPGRGQADGDRRDPRDGLRE